MRFINCTRFEEENEAYDWCRPCDKRTPSEYPYSFDDYFVWREFDKSRVPKDIEAYYTDRMREWDSEKYLAACHGKMTNFGSIPKTRADAKKITREYFGDNCECVGIAQSVNHSSGYPLGIFYVKRNMAAE